MTTLEQSAARCLRETREREACQGLTDAELANLPTMLEYLKGWAKHQGYCPRPETRVAKRAFEILRGVKGTA